jgi:hypothetical protein
MGVTVLTVAVCVAAYSIDLGNGIQGLLLRTGLVVLWVAVVFIARWVDPDEIRSAVRLATRRAGRERSP